MEQYLIDINAVSDYLSFLLPPNGMSFVDMVINNIPNLSVISQIELLCWDIDDAVKIGHVKNFIEDAHIYEITSDVIMNCVSIRKGKKIKTPDAIIAATALTYGYTLITINEKDFKHIADLKILNPALL